MISISLSNKTLSENMILHRGDKMESKRVKLIKRVAVILFWILIWYIAARIIHKSIIFVGPIDVVHSLAGQVLTKEFWVTIAYSMSRIGLGFITAFIAGAITGMLGYRFKILKDLLEPVIVLMKSIPVASFVILALIWIGSANLAVLVGFSIVFPLIYVNTIAGLNNADSKLLEMAQVFKVSGWSQFKYIYRPALLPFLISGCKTALGMCWKSGIAAEVIGVPAKSIGERLYMAKIYLNTADLFAWTIVIIVLSALTEKLLIYLLNKLL